MLDINQKRVIQGPVQEQLEKSYDFSGDSQLPQFHSDPLKLPDRQQPRYHDVPGRSYEADEAASNRPQVLEVDKADLHNYKYHSFDIIEIRTPEHKGNHVANHNQRVFDKSLVKDDNSDLASHQHKSPFQRIALADSTNEWENPQPQESAMILSNRPEHLGARISGLNEAQGKFLPSEFSHIPVRPSHVAEQPHSFRAHTIDKSQFPQESSVFHGFPENFHAPVASPDSCTIYDNYHFQPEPVKAQLINSPTNNVSRIRTGRERYQNSFPNLLPRPSAGEIRGYRPTRRSLEVDRMSYIPLYRDTANALTYETPRPGILPRDVPDDNFDLPKGSNLGTRELYMCREYAYRSTQNAEIPVASEVLNGRQVWIPETITRYATSQASPLR